MANALAETVAGLLRTITALLVVALAAGLTAVVVQGGPEALLELGRQQLGRLLALADQGTAAAAQAAPAQRQASAAENPAVPVPPPLYHSEREAAPRDDDAPASAAGTLVPVQTASFVREDTTGDDSAPGAEPLANWNALERELRQLGVTRWRLECVPEGRGPRVRFRCEVPCSVRPGWVRFVQAEATTPREAIARVLAALRRRGEEAPGQ